MRTAALEDRRACARKVHLPRLRGDHRAARALASHPARIGGAEPAGDDRGSKFLLHQPLNRQAATYAREGVEIDASTMADWVGACVVTLDPILAC